MRRIALVGAFGMVFAASGCAATQSSATRDAQVDEGTIDGGMDAALDGGIDAARDGGIDAARDATILDDMANDLGNDASTCGGPLGCLVEQTHALSFNGSQYVTVPGSTAFGFPAGTFTIEAWINMSMVVPTYPTIVSTRDPGGTSNGILFGITGRETDGTPLGTPILQLQAIHYSAPAPQAELRDGTWHHVAVTGADSTLKFYADGVFLGMTTYTGEIASTANLSIGMDKPSGTIGGMRGVICQVRVWSVERSESEIRSAMDRTDVPTAGLVAYWPLNEGSGQNVNDIAAGSLHDGVLGEGSGDEEEDPTWIDIASL